MDTLNRDDIERLYEPYWADGWPSVLACGDGWLGILADLAQKFGTLNEPVQVLQIKEKFAGLRVYVATESPQVEEWIRAAELAAASTCENCGNPGAL